MTSTNSGMRQVIYVMLVAAKFKEVHTMMLVYNRTTEKLNRENEPRVPASDEVVWIRMTDPKPQEVERVLGGLFHCHPLLVEDCIKLNQRPKMDRYKNNIFLSFFAIEAKTLEAIEMGIIVGENYVITISKKEVPFLDKVSEDFEQVTERMQHPGDILHNLLDHCVDDYSEITDQIESRVEKMERGIYRNPYIRIAQEIFQLKRIMHQLRRIITEEKSILGTISHTSFPYARQESDVYFIDIYDHISRVVDSLDAFRESLTGLLELQMSMKSDRMNEIMKTLTIISTVFLPLTFIVGLYGMNFKYIPELNWDFGYLYVWILLVAVTAGMWIYFKRKKWL
jgi:magnesium transporter